MLKVIAALLVVVLCVKSATSLNLWGSRVITQRSGPVTLYLEPPISPSDCYVTMYLTEDDPYTLKINTKTQICTFWNFTEWSAPCNYDNKKIQIAVKDVRALAKLTVRSLKDDILYISVIFAPYCKFATPQYDQVVPEESAPLSKFVKGQSVVPIRFAIMAAYSELEVKLFRNGKLLCQWEGIKYISGDGCGWEYLRPDYEKNIRVFRRNYSVPSTREYYEFVGPKNSLSVTVDPTQAGESTEMADCKYNAISPELWGSQIITQKTGPLTLNLETQGNAGHSEIIIIRGNWSKRITINSDTKRCLDWRGTEWSAPCSYDKTKLQITVKDVTAQDKVLIYSPEPYFTQLSVVFAPGCKFPALKQDEFVAKESAPLSKFEKGQSDVMIRFAIVGADSQSEVSMWKNGKLLCKWKGIEYASGDGCGRINLIKDDVNNWRVFKETFPVPYYVDFYAFHTPISELMVTVDPTLAGESTEMADC